MNIMTGFRDAARYLGAVLGIGVDHGANERAKARYIICHPMRPLHPGHHEGARIQCADGAQSQYLNGMAIKLRSKATNSVKRAPTS